MRKPNDKTAAAQGRRQKRVVRAWVARDTTKINIGRRPSEATLLFTRKPKLKDCGFWYAYGHDGDGGRWPIPNSLRLKPGQCMEVTISPNAPHQPPPGKEREPR